MREEASKFLFPGQPRKCFTTDSSESCFPDPITTIKSRTQARIVGFDDCPDANPKNWSFPRKVFVFFLGLFAIINSGIATSLPTNAVPFIMNEFNVTNDGQSTLPTAVFLVGYIVGPIVFSPLSETVGRRPVLVPTFAVFFLATLGCALAPNWPSLLFFRLVAGTMGAAPQTIVGGIYADMFELRARGRAMTCYMAGASFGPILGPIISGFASISYGWRWTFWIALIFAGVTLMGLIFLPETFEPVILKHRAAYLTKETGHQHVAPSSGVNSLDIWTIFKRPLDMFLMEPIISSTSIFISLAYALVFFYFQAYPLIFPKIYNFDIQMTSLAFLPVGIGAASTGLIALMWDLHYEKARATGKQWRFSPELHRLPISCAGSICIVIGLFWLAWTAKPSIHWAVPTASGFIFGFGYQTIFISLLTYVTDAYKIYSASALASSVILRSMLGAVLPVAAKPMYTHLGIGWATSIIGFLSLACVPIPFVLLFKGDWIRERSKFCQMLVKSEWPGAAESHPGSSRGSLQIQEQKQEEERGRVVAEC